MVRPEGASGPVSQSTSAFAILPINLAATPKEGSKALKISVDWTKITRFDFAGTQSSVINLLQQYQTGQFTAIQSVWIDNTNNWLAVDLIAAETGERIRCPAQTQGMFPLMSAVAPVFTLINNPVSSSVLFVPGATQLQLLNTPQRYFINRALPTLEGGTGFATATVADGTVTALINNPFLLVAPKFMRLTGFRLFVSEGAPVTSGTAATVKLVATGAIVGTLWEGCFNLSPSSSPIVFDSGQVTFPEPVMPPSTDNIYYVQFGMFSGSFPSGGFAAFLSYNFDIITLG